MQYLGSGDTFKQLKNLQKEYNFLLVYNQRIQMAKQNNNNSNNNPNCKKRGNYTQLMSINNVENLYN